MIEYSIFIISDFSGTMAKIEESAMAVSPIM